MTKQPALTMSEFCALPNDIKDAADQLTVVHGLGDRAYAIAACLKAERDKSQQYVDFSEEIRSMLGMGYGEGYQLSDMLRVVKGRNSQWLARSTDSSVRSALMALMKAYSQCNDEDHPAYLAAEKALKA